MTQTKNATDTEVWYALEYSRKGEDDWCAVSGTHDTPERAKERMAGLVRQRSEYPSAIKFEFRVVRKTLTSEPVA
jgi:hypothetical protein